MLPFSARAAETLENIARPHRARRVELRQEPEPILDVHAGRALVGRRDQHADLCPRVALGKARCAPALSGLDG